MPTAAELLADHAIQAVTLAASDLFAASLTPEGQRAILGAMKRLGDDWLKIGDTLKHVAKAEAA